MNKYGKQSRQNLSECHKDLQLIFTVVLLSWDNTVLTGERNEKEQTEKFVSGQSKVRYPHSYHNKKPSMAADVSPYPIPEKWGDGNRNEYEKFRYFAFYVLGIADALFQANLVTHKLTWGGDWDGDNDVNDQDFNDLIHFQLEKI